MTDKPPIPMPEAYRNPRGRIIRANPTIHRLVCRGDLRLTPCAMPEPPQDPGGAPMDDVESVVRLAKSGADISKMTAADISKRIGIKVSAKTVKIAIDEME